MVYGIDELDEFNKRIVNEFGQSVHYFEVEKRNGKTSFKVHTAVSDTMDRLARHVECRSGETALGDLLRIVKCKLLVAELDAPPIEKGKTHDASADTKMQSRADSRTLERDLADIIEQGNKDRSYWLKIDQGHDSQGPDTITPARLQHNTSDPLNLAGRGSYGSDEGIAANDSESVVPAIMTGNSIVSGAVGSHATGYLSFK